MVLSEPIEELDVYRAIVESWFSYCNSMDPECWSDWGKSNPNIPPLIFLGNGFSEGYVIFGVTVCLPCPSNSIATACGNRLMSVSQHSLLSISPGTLRKSPRCIFTSSALGSFKGAFQPSPALGIILKGRDFKGTLSPKCSLDGTQVINFSEITTSPSFTSMDFRL